MAAGDVVISGDVKLTSGLRFVWGTVTLDGSNPTPVDLSNYLSAVHVGVATIEGTAATGADPNQVTTAVSTTTLNVYAWKVTIRMGYRPRPPSVLGQPVPAAVLFGGRKRPPTVSVCASYGVNLTVGA